MSLIRFLFILISQTLHQIFGIGDCCRFSPTCTYYAVGAIQEHGVIRGGILALRRVFKCRPFSLFGYDPIPRRVL